jgi:hypothetical protein
MHQVQLNYLKVKAKWDLAMEQLEAGIKIADDELNALEDELLDAEDALRDWIIPMMVAQGMSEQDVKDVFAYKSEQAIDLALRLRV